MKFKNIIFDFDGTLINSKPGIVKSFQKLVKELTFEQIDEQEISQLIGTPLVPMLIILLNTNDKAIINKGVDLFREYYSKKGVYQNIIYPGIKEMLEFFKGRSHQLFVVSNKIEVFMNKILEQHNLKKYFISILATDGTDARSKKADYIKYILTHYKLKKEETVMVGDTEDDIAAAKKNFVYSIGITWGYGAELNLIKAEADAICHTPLELEQFIIENNGKRKKT